MIAERVLSPRKLNFQDQTSGERVKRMGSSKALWLGGMADVGCMGWAIRLNSGGAQSGLDYSGLVREAVGADGERYEAAIWLGTIP
jgi:hypothetical protein